MNLKPIEIANKINRMTKGNVFENPRKKETVELRSLLVYLLREKLGMRWTNIAKFFQNNNKPMNHATAIYNCNNYSMYKKYNKNLIEIERLFTFKSNLNIDEIDRVHYLENKCKNLEEKINSPLLDMMLKIPKDKEDEAILKIKLLLRSWEWKKNN